MKRVFVFGLLAAMLFAFSTSVSSAPVLKKALTFPVKLTVHCYWENQAAGGAEVFVTPIIINKDGSRKADTIHRMYQSADEKGVASFMLLQGKPYIVYAEVLTTSIGPNGEPQPPSETNPSPSATKNVTMNGTMSINLYIK